MQKRRNALVSYQRISQTYMEQQSGKHIEKPLGASWLYPPNLSLDLLLLVFHEATREGPRPSDFCRTAAAAAAKQHAYILALKMGPATSRP